MPNWCRNEMHVSFGNWLMPEPEKEAFLEALKESIPNYEKRLEANLKSDREKNTWLYWGSERKRKPFDFDNFVPYPEEFAARDRDAMWLSREEMTAKYGSDKDAYNDGGYEWCIENWGTKWSASKAVWVNEHSTLYFDTPWCPPIKIISALHERFPKINISFEFYERGTGSMGGFELVSEEDWNLDYEMYTPMGGSHAIEVGTKLLGDVPKGTWKAGQIYNYWEAEYKGYKGG